MGYSTRRQGKVARYPSIFSPSKYVTFVQYLAELMCDRRAKNLKVDLPNEFWLNSPQWKSYYFYQMKLAGSLKRAYSEEAILAALREMKYTYSLGLKNLKDVIIKHEKELRVKKSEKPADIILPDGLGRFNRKKGNLGKLDDD